ncbi:hypothetical protein Ciccas_001547 [Cichlidogyrus casuarinus]|uniref:Cilia- and flagella-associated protein 206 n=1 Tax=Cichlidogyrus casuarinus TaxID=1844966 RepID=A0ABD2QMW7_9PLAT
MYFILIHSKIEFWDADLFDSYSTFQPAFVSLYKAWGKLQDEMVCLSVIANILSNLSTFSTVTDQSLSEANLSDFISPEEIVSDEARRVSKKLNRFLPSYLAGPPFSNIFCIKEKRERLSTKAIHGRKIVDAETDLAEQYIELKAMIQLLNLQNYFANSKLILGNKMKPSFANDCSIQTETHPIDSHIDWDYHWNEWELRRRAIKLADIKNKKTRSLQTNLSHFLRDNVTQVWLPKDKGVMSKKENYSQVPKPSMFIHGLRGNSDSFPQSSWSSDLHKPTNAFKLQSRVMFSSEEQTNFEKPGGAMKEAVALAAALSREFQQIARNEQKEGEDLLRSANTQESEEEGMSAITYAKEFASLSYSSMGILKAVMSIVEQYSGSQ